MEALQAAPLPSLEDVIKLLKGNTDSQRLAGLLLVTKFCDKEDKTTILSVYNAIGSSFLHRLLLTGMGKGGGGANIDSHDRYAYLQLAVTILAAFARIPELAVTHEMLSEIPLVLEVLHNQSDLCLTGQCFEFVFLVATAQEDVATTFYSSGGMNVLASQMSALPDALQSLMSDDWSANIRAGVMDVLLNRVGPAEKLHALVLAQHAISIVGTSWLIANTNLPDGHGSFPSDRCILLILESSRVEIDVLLNELAYLKYEAPKHSTPNSETFPETLRNLGVAYALVERIIKLMSKFGEEEDSKSDPIIYDSTLIKMIGGLNETIGVVLDYLQDAKDHGDRKGDDLLASVRVVGRR